MIYFRHSSNERRTPTRIGPCCGLGASAVASKGRRSRPGIVLCLFGFLFATGGAWTANQRPAAEPIVVLFQNGQWFDGEKFEPGNRFSVDGTLRQRWDGRVTKRVDLAGGFVLPAFGEGHNHNVSRPPRADEVERYVRAGVFYVLVLNNLTPSTFQSAEAIPLDVLYANGGLTAPGGHVVQLHERLVDLGVLSVSKSELDGLAFFLIDSATDLDRQWPRFLAGKPDIVKIFLGASEEHARRRNDPAFYGMRGLDPALVPSITRRAHEAGLRVAAHIETAADFRIAVEGGVDIIAHLPGWRVGEEAGFEDTLPERWLLTPDDARKAAARGVIVVTTAIAGDAALDPSHAHYDIVRDLHRRNLQTLQAASVKLALGSDYWNGTSVIETLYLAHEPVIQGVAPLGVFDNLTLVHLLAVDTPRAIFPDRPIGGLQDGDEATFVVLEGDPIASLRNLLKIRMRILHGRTIELPGVAASSPPRAIRGDVAVG